MPFPNIAGQKTNEWFVALPPGHTFEDLLSPAYWSHHAGRRLQKNDIIRAVANDGSFDATFTVCEKLAGGVKVVPWPAYPPGFSPEARALAAEQTVEPSVVPILSNGKAAVRVDHTETTKWRCIGLDGEPIITGLEAEEDAVKKLNEYLKALNMRLPTAEEFAAAAKAREEKAAEVAEKDAARASRRGR